ncbi:MAG: DNA-3-methyladenine glycosylase I [Albidovulum sp.]|nr:DNA-3-methyladenine glycosylase I [Albidovulum sp.]
MQLSPGRDGKLRCFGNEPGKEFYAAYHDKEWGKPVHDDIKLFEMLLLEGAQAGLSWETILRKRQGYREAFHGFDPRAVADMSDNELEMVGFNPEIVRNRLKIYSARSNAVAFIEIQNEFGSFDEYLWRFVDGRTIVNEWASFDQVPARSPESEALSKDLRKRGMKFVGPTIMYAFMQAVGMVDDHLTTCWVRVGGAELNAISQIELKGREVS